MKTQNSITTFPKNTRTQLAAVLALVIATLPLASNAQAVSEIITDYNGYWKTSVGSVSSVKPDNHHNLLSFSYNGTRYSTGVNDALLSSNGETFTAGNFQALPLQNVNGTVSSNTKIGIGALADGVNNGAGPAPSRVLGSYLNDGVNGLDLGTGIANLPAGYMFMSVSNIQAANIGDGIPDILVTQIADPSSSHDFYEFTDVNGNRIGNSLDVVLDNITPIGNWTADFYEATGSTVLSSGFTQTTRAIRLWAADFSSFGLNASNIANIAYFKINLNGNSDIAFVAYNSATITVQQVLDINAANRVTRITPARTEEVTNVSLFPNPSNGTINVVHPAASAKDRIDVYNAAGLMMMSVAPSASSTSTKINMGVAKKGSYQAVYQGDNSRSALKFIIQ